MNIDIQARGLPLTRSLTSYVQRKFSSTLASNQPYIVRTQVRLSDINGPRGGVDKLCQFNISLAGVPDVVIQETSTNIYAAISNAIKRASRNIGRRLGKSGRLKLPTKKRKAVLSSKHQFTV